MKTPLRLAAFAGAAAALLASPSAHADAPAPTGIWVDAQPWTCVSETGPFARHLELACDALGGKCRVSASPKEASFRAILSCAAGDDWTLEVQKSDGADVLTLALEGDREQRLRKAAMWAAHVSIGQPPSRKAARAAAPAPAPEPETETDIEPEQGPPVPPPPPAPPAPPAPPLDAPDAIAPRPRAEPRWGLTGAGLAGIAGNPRGDIVAGGRAGALLGLGSGIFLGPAFTYAQGISHHDSGTLYLGGLTLGYGAPFGGRWLGAAIEGGAGAGSGAPEYWYNGPEMPVGYEHFRRDDGDRVKATGYARAALILQVPVALPVRPTLTLAGMHVSHFDGGSGQMATLELGLACPGW